MMNKEDNKSSVLTDVFKYDNIALIGTVSIASIALLSGAYYAYSYFHSQSVKKNYEDVLKETAKKYKDMDYH